MGEREKGRAGTATKALGIYALVLMLVVLGITGILWAKLSSFQKNQALAVESEKGHAVLEALEGWRSERDGQDWAEEWFRIHPESDETIRHAADFFARLAADSATGFFVEADSEAKLWKFILANNGKAVARITVQESNETAEVIGAELLWQGVTEFTVCGPADAKLSFGGELSDRVPDELGSAVPVNEIKPLCNGERMTARWILREMTTAEDILASCAEETEFTEEGLQLRSDRVAQICRQRAADFTRSYLSYYLRGEDATERNLAEVLALVGEDTPAYQLLLDTMDGVSWNHSYEGIDVSQVNVGQAVEIADNCFYTDAEYRALYSENGQAKEYGSGSFRIYFLNRPGRGYEICYFELRQS